MQFAYEKFAKGERMYSRLTHSWLKHWDFILLDMICLFLAGICDKTWDDCFVEYVFVSG